MRLALSAVKWLVFGIMLTHMTSGMGDDMFIFVFCGIWLSLEEARLVSTIDRPAYYITTIFSHLPTGGEQTLRCILRQTGWECASRVLQDVSVENFSEDIVDVICLCSTLNSIYRKKWMVHYYYNYVVRRA